MFAKKPIMDTVGIAARDYLFGLVLLCDSS